MLIFISNKELKKRVWTSSIIVFFILICTPLILSAGHIITGRNFDFELAGYSDPIKMPEKSLSAWLSGDFQKDFDNLFEVRIRPRGFYIRNYSQIQYSLFGVNNTNVPESDGTVDNELFIKDALMIGEDCDYSVPEKQREMQEYVNDLSEASDKLEKINKHLIIYTTPTKSTYMPEHIPYRYKAAYNKDGVRAIDCFRSLIQETHVNYIDASKFIDDVPYPAFYKTSFHWARPIEQLTEQKVVEKMAEVSGLNIPRIKLGDIHTSSEPIKRDADAWNGMNIYQHPNPDTYYEYGYSVDYPEGYDKPRMILQADSFASWFQTYDYDQESMTYIFYDDSLWSLDEYYSLNDDIRSLDLGKYLDKSDFVVIEVNEALLYQYSSGFVHYLNEYLDSYVPSAGE